jgi:hypothetical protein
VIVTVVQTPTSSKTRITPLQKCLDGEGDRPCHSNQRSTTRVGLLSKFSYETNQEMEGLYRTLMSKN